jgi:hypothetical protein
LQERPTAVFGHEVAGRAGFARPLPDAPHGTAANSRDAPRAISAGCPGNFADRRDRRRSSGGGIRGDVGAGSRSHCRHAAVAETGTGQSNAGNTGSIAAHASILWPALPERGSVLVPIESPVEFRTASRRWGLYKSEDRKGLLRWGQPRRCRSPISPSRMVAF